MKKTVVLVCCLALVAMAGFARTIHPPANPYWEAIFAPGDSAPGATAVREVSSGAKRPAGKVICSAAANCPGGATVSCASSTPGDTCSAVDSACPSVQGYVRCGTSYTYCAACTCTEGALRTFPTGNCCDDGTREKEQDQCVGGQWTYYDTICGPLLCRPIQQ